MLRQLLCALGGQEVGGLFSYSVVVTDNDKGESARIVAGELAERMSVPLTYSVEPEQNIALARNKCLDQARGDLIAFIDDDEVPAANWLYTLYVAMSTYAVDGILGPVRPKFEGVPPTWARRGKFYERPEYQSGYRLSWAETRTGNVLFRRETLSGLGTPFRAEFGTGSEDVDFFRRAIELGKTFAWCNEAAVYEWVPLSRCSRWYLLHRALVRGSTFPQRRGNRLRSLAKSVIALPVYALILPFTALAGQHVFLKVLIKIFDHGSRLLAYVGWPLVRERKN